MRYFLIVLFFMTACTQQKDSSDKVQKVYFDLASIVQNDIDINAQTKAGEEKTVLINGATETKKIDTVHWEKELETIINCDINKPSWKGKYLIQTTKNPRKISYLATSSKIPVRNMVVFYKAQTDSIYYIEIEKKMGTFIFSNEQHIFYYPKKSFKIIAKQQAVFMNDFNSEITVNYLLK